MFSLLLSICLFFPCLSQSEELPQNDCQETALGMQSHEILDDQITASSKWRSDYAASQGRLHHGKGWAPDTEDVESEWLQIDLVSPNTNVKGVATQGNSATAVNEWVTEYKPQYSNDGVNFRYYKEQGNDTEKVFPGNTDPNSVVFHGLDPPIRARYIRFRPLAYHQWMTMRVELYGCQGF